MSAVAGRRRRRPALVFALFAAVAAAALLATTVLREGAGPDGDAIGPGPAASDAGPAVAGADDASVGLGAELADSEGEAAGLDGEDPAFAPTPDEDAARASGDGTVAQGAPAQCPLVIPDAQERSWHENAAGVSWTYLTPRDAREVGADVLEQLKEGGFSLEESGYLGITDAAWGCVATAPGKDGVVMVCGLPAEGEGGGGREARLEVTVVSLFAGEDAGAVEDTGGGGR